MASRGSSVALRHVEQWAWLCIDGDGTVALDDDYSDAEAAWEVLPEPAAAGAAREYRLRLRGGGAALAPAGRGHPDQQGDHPTTSGRWRIENLGDGTCALAAVAAAAAGETVYLCADEEGAYLDYEPHAWSVELKGLPVIDITGLTAADVETQAAAAARVGHDVATLAGDVGFFAVAGDAGLEAAAAKMVAAAHASLAANSAIGAAGAAEGAAAGDDAPFRRNVVKSTLASSTGWVKTRMVGDEERAGPPGWWDSDAAAHLPVFYAALDGVAQALLRAVCGALGLPGLEELGSSSNLRMMTYPAARDGDAPSGLEDHTDKDWLTVLVQDGTPGLEVEGRNAAEWVPIAGDIPVVVNVGDALQALSGGVLKSKVHRAVAPVGRARISFPLFVEPQTWPEARGGGATKYIVQEL